MYLSGSRPAVSCHNLRFAPLLRSSRTKPSRFFLQPYKKSGILPLDLVKANKRALKLSAYGAYA